MKSLGGKLKGVSPAEADCVDCLKVYVLGSVSYPLSASRLRWRSPSTGYGAIWGAVVYRGETAGCSKPLQ